MISEIYNHLLSSSSKPVENWDHVNYFILDKLLDYCVKDENKKNFIEETVSEIMNRMDL